MKKHKGFYLPVLVMLICGCSKAGYAANSLSSGVQLARSSGYAGQASATVMYEASYNDEAGSTGEDAAVLTDASMRKLVKRANIHVRVDDLDAADTSVGVLMERYGAYPSSTESSDNYRGYVIRVPSSSYDTFLGELGGMGRILRHSESSEDVSLRYYDLEGRLATREELLKTFRSYLGKATDIDEILSVEARIAELQNEIDRTGRDLRLLADLVDYSTVSLDIFGPVAAEQYRGSTLAERVKELFSGFGGFLSTAVVVLIGIVIYGIPAMLLLVLLFWLLFGRVGLVKKLFRAAADKKKDKNNE